VHKRWRSSKQNLCSRVASWETNVYSDQNYLEREQVLIPMALLRTQLGLSLTRTPTVPQQLRSKQIPAFRPRAYNCQLRRTSLISCFQKTTLRFKLLAIPTCTDGQPSTVIRLLEGFSLQEPAAATAEASSPLICCQPSVEVSPAICSGFWKPTLSGCMPLKHSASPPHQSS